MQIYDILYLILHYILMVILKARGSFRIIFDNSVRVGDRVNPNKIFWINRTETDAGKLVSHT